MAYIVMAYIVMAYIVMVYIVMAYIAMAYTGVVVRARLFAKLPPWRPRKPAFDAAIALEPVDSAVEGAVCRVPHAHMYTLLQHTRNNAAQQSR